MDAYLLHHKSIALTASKHCFCSAGGASSIIPDANVFPLIIISGTIAAVTLFHLGSINVDAIAFKAVGKELIYNYIDSNFCSRSLIYLFH